MTAIPKRVRVQVLLRDHNCCRRCGVHISVRGYSLHHRKGRQGEDANLRSNLVTLCGSGTTPNGCHAWAHSHPEKAYATGWMVRRLGDDDPAEVPLVDVAGRVFCLTDEGDVIPWSGDAAFVPGLRGAGVSGVGPSLLGGTGPTQPNQNQGGSR